MVRPDGVAKLDIGIKEGIITALGNTVFGSTSADLDAGDFHIFPGGVDPHVHFNEPGRTEWEGFDHGSRALAAGGVTSYFDMPLNSLPPVLDKSGFLAKWNFGKASSLVDFGLWGGLTPDSLGAMQELTDCGVIGFKAFMRQQRRGGFSALRRWHAARRHAARVRPATDRRRARGERRHHVRAGQAGHCRGATLRPGLPGFAARHRRTGGHPARDPVRLGNGVRAAYRPRSARRGGWTSSREPRRRV